MFTIFLDVALMISTIQTQLIFVTNINGVGTLFEAGLHFPQLNVNGIVLCEVYPENFQAIPEICSKIPNDLQYCFSLFFSRQLFCEFTHFSAYNFKASNWCCCTKNVSGNPYIEKHKWRRIFEQCLKEQWGGYCSVPLIWIDDKREKVERTNKYDGQAMSRFSP